MACSSARSRSSSAFGSAIIARSARDPAFLACAASTANRRHAMQRTAIQRTLFALAFSLTAVAAPLGVQAQAWPSKTVTLVVPFPPGGSTDTIARASARSCRRSSARPSSSTTRPARPARSARRRSSAPRPTATPCSSPRSGPLVIAPHLMKNVPYDAGKDFDCSPSPCRRPTCWSVPAASPHKSVADVLAVPEGQPGQDDVRLVGQRLVGSPDRRTVLARRRAPAACTCRTRAARRRSPTCSAARSMRRSRTSTP